MRNLCLSLLCLSASGMCVDKPVVGAYFENWAQYRPASGGREKFSVSMIDPSIITDLYYAFALFGFITKSIDPNNPRLTGDYTMQPIEWNDISTLYPEVMALKKCNHNLRNILSIGGWTLNLPSDPNIGAFTYKLFAQMVASKDNRTQFITSAITYLQKYGFDGIDIDWEYPGDLTRGGTEADFDNFVTFLNELYTACKAVTPPLLVTYASAAIVPNGVPQKYKDNPNLYYEWLAKCAPYLDRFNIMTYDYHGSFDDPKLTGCNAPLSHDTDPKSLLFIEQTLNNYIQNGVPANKIVLGMATYGHSYDGVTGLSSTDNGPGKPFTSAGAGGPSTQQPGLLAYFEIADMIALKDLTFGSDSTTSTAFGYNISGKKWVSFDTPQTIQLKAQLAVKLGLLGGMFWAVDMDEYAWSPTYPNIESGYKVFYP